MIVTVGGSVASGKSTLAKNLAEKLGYTHLSAGKVMRQMAEEKGVDLIEFSHYAENNPEVDREIDERQKKLAVGDCVVDGRLSAHFLDADLTVWLKAPQDVRARRVLQRGEEYDSLEDTVDAIEVREASEHKRYLEFYGIDLADLSVYDIVLDTGTFGIVEMTSMLEHAVGLLN